MTAAHRLAFTDWLACAVRGAREPAAVAARATGDGLLERVAAAGAAGHVLDYDDTYEPGLAHLSAATAPAALVFGAHRGTSVGDVLAAHAAGFEATATLSAACHPALYDGGWHPTAVCGGAGAAVAAARLLALDLPGERNAIAIALLRAGGLRAAFGSDGKALQVGLAAAAGVQAALLADAGASVDADEVAGGAAGFAGAFGVATSAATLDAMLAAADAAASAPQAAPANWIKAYPCCLQTHAAIDAALAFRSAPGPTRGLDRPPGAGLDRPPGTGLDRPPGTGLDRPPGAGLDRAPGTGLDRPPGAGLDRAPGTGLDRPPGAALGLALDARIVVAVHPLSRKAAALDTVRDGLQAKFSIPYLTAYALLHGAPDLASFDAVDAAAAALGARIEVRTDTALGTSEARLEIDGKLATRITAPRGSPANPLDAEALSAKVRELAGSALDGALDDPQLPATELLRRTGL